MTPIDIQYLSKRVFENEDFSGRDLRGVQAHHSVFRNCNFDKADLSDANCERSDFTGSTFRDANCRGTNFKDATLANTIFQPKDCYGMTITLQCKTFQGARISQLWWYGLLVFASMMVPDRYPIQEPISDNLIAMIGAERYIKLKALFRRREL